ncbi:MAG: glycosyltransferase family 9 protein [Bacteroidales bacterium]|jgi:ADP-heptose:LPS heptosyltransferase|nr:glycosyltransferase family 9 protein [Bacteroidales bacterium]
MDTVKFLIIRFSSIGDIVLTSPVVRLIKQQVENAEIHYLTKPQFKSLVETNPNIDKVHILDKSFKKTLQTLKYEHYQYIIDLHKNLRSLRVKNSLKIISFSFDKLNYQKWLLVNFNRNILPKKHIVDRYIEPLSVFDIKNDNKGLDFFIPNKDIYDLNNLPENFESGFVAVVLGAKHNTKRLTTEKYISICEKINKPIVLLGGKENKEEGQIIKNKIVEKIFNACGILNINQSASLIKNSRLVITPDTGLMHIAAALKKKIISIWGNTVPDFGMYPYFPHPDSEMFQVENLKCRPCSKIGFSECPKKHFKCINNLNINDIINKALELF